MKKNIFTTALIFSVLFSFAQRAGRTPFPLNVMMKMKQLTNDTIWLYHKYTAYQWDDSVFTTYMIDIFDYYPGTANWKSVIVIYGESDTTEKYNYFYDENNRLMSLIIQNYTGNPGNEWMNTYREDQVYNAAGWDSLTVSYTWSPNDSVWKKKSKKSITYYYNYGEKFFHVESTFLWDGEQWVMSDGYKRDFLFNEFGQIYDKKVSLYKNNEWVYDFRDTYHLINDTTGEYDSFDTQVWQDGQWQPYYKFTEIILHNWQGFTNYVSDINYEKIVKQWWDGTQWKYIKKTNKVFDTLGGHTDTLYAWLDNKWEITRRYRELFNERKLRTLISREDFNNNHWDTIWANRYFFEYIGSIWRVMHYQDYDTTLRKWVPAYDHVLSDFTYILNTPEIKSSNKSPGLKVIPNPAKNTVSVRLNDKADRIKTVRIFNISGQRIFEKIFQDKRQQEYLNISALKKGVYILQVITTDNMILNGKFVKN